MVIQVVNITLGLSDILGSLMGEGATDFGASARAMAWCALGAAAVWGALWGSFLNVVIGRVPRGESVVTPASHCQSCNSPVRWFDNIPLVSYLLLRGRCRHCGARFSPRYLLVEALFALLNAAVFASYVIDNPTDSLGLRLAQFVILSLFFGVLVAIAFIDLDTMRIPNVITYPGIPLAVLASPFLAPVRWWDGLVGAVAGYLVLRLIADGYEWLTGRVGMGYGDAKLLALIGGLLGWRVLLPVVFLGALQGTLIGVTFLLLTRKGAEVAGDDCDEAEIATRAAADAPEAAPAPSRFRELRHARLPFGPFLSLAAIEVVFLRQYLPSIFPYLFGTN